MRFNFTDATRRTLARARDFALARRHERVTPEHIAVAALQDSDVAALISGWDLDPVALRLAIEGLMEPGSADPPPMGELPYSTGARKTLEYAMGAARDTAMDAVLPLHLLIAVFTENSGAAKVLSGHGLTEDRLRYRAGDYADTRLHFAIDESSDVSIYEQIVMRVTEPIATGSVQEGERLPTVRRLADHLDIAPGTVARAYAELERQGLVVTEGARGTRVAARKPATPRPEVVAQLAGLIRPVAVAAFHMGARAEDLRRALEEASVGIFVDGDGRSH